MFDKLRLRIRNANESAREAAENKEPSFILPVIIWVQALTEHVKILDLLDNEQLVKVIEYADNQRIKELDCYTKSELGYRKYYPKFRVKAMFKDLNGSLSIKSAELLRIRDNFYNESIQKQKLLISGLAFDKYTEGFEVIPVVDTEDKVIDCTVGQYNEITPPKYEILQTPVTDREGVEKLQQYFPYLITDEDILRACLTEKSENK